MMYKINISGVPQQPKSPRKTRWLQKMSLAVRIQTIQNILILNTFPKKW